MVFNDGDFVKIDYNAWRVADNKLIYTTNRTVAADNKVLDDETRYVPQLIVIGKGNAIKGVENAVRTMNVSESKKVELDPKDAFGERDPGLVKVMSVSDFKKRDIDPYPGMQLDLDGAVATIKSVNSGRVVVDANHPLAGERLLYEIKIVSKLEKGEDKIRAIADTLPLTPDSVAVNGDTVKVTFGGKVEKDSKYLVNKNDFVNLVRRYMDGVAKVTVEEDYTRAKQEEAKK